MSPPNEALVTLSIADSEGNPIPSQDVISDLLTQLASRIRETGLIKDGSHVKIRRNDEPDLLATNLSDYTTVFFSDPHRGSGSWVVDIRLELPSPLPAWRMSRPE